MCIYVFLKQVFHLNYKSEFKLKQNGVVPGLSVYYFTINHDTLTLITIITLQYHKLFTHLYFIYIYILPNKIKLVLDIEVLHFEVLILYKEIVSFSFI